MKPSKMQVAAGETPDRKLLGSLRRSLAAELAIQDLAADRRDLPSLPTGGLLQQLSAAIYEIGADGAITAYNDAAAVLWGRRPVIGHDCWCGAVRLLDRAGTPVASASSPAALALATGEPAGGELIIERPDGLAVPISALASPQRNAAGRLVGAIVTLVVVTDQADPAHSIPAQERYRLAAEASDDVIWDQDLVNGTVEWNHALKTRFGYDPSPEQRSFGWWLERIHPEDADRINEHIATALAGGQVTLSAEYRFRRADGAYADVLGRGWLLRDGDGRPIRAVGALIDLSERKATQEALRISEERMRLATDAAQMGIADYDLVTGEVHWSNKLR